MKQTIGFIGQGWIGMHYADNFEERGYEVIRYSLEEPYVNNKKKLEDCNIIFVAVPTPTTPKGFDDSILINSIRDNTYPTQSIVIKSTIKLGTTEKIQALFPDRYIFHSPEFLTEKTAEHDAANPARNILGYTEKSFSKATIVMDTLPVAPYENIVKAEEAEFVKYMGNCWFYFKVMAMNLFWDVANDNDLDFDLLKEMLAADKRVGRTHLDVLHQGGRGAGGHCFIKDFAAFREMYEKMKDMNNFSASGLELLKTMEDFNKALLKQSDKDLVLLSGVYGPIT